MITLKVMITLFLINFTNVLLQVTATQQTIQASNQAFILQIFGIIVGLIGTTFTFIIALRVNKVKAEAATTTLAVAGIKTDVNAVTSGISEVKTEVITLKEQTNGNMTKLLQLTEEKNQRIGEDIGRDKSKAEHEEQSKKDADSNIAKGKIEGLAEAKAEQTFLPASTEPAKVEVVNKEDNPAKVVVNEKTKKLDK